MASLRERRVRTLLAFLVTACVGIWIGGSLVVDFLVAPAAFDILPRPEAGELGERIFTLLNYAECLLGAASVLIAFGMGRPGWGAARRHFLATATLLLMMIIALTYLVGLTPAIKAMTDSLKTQGPGFDGPAPEREALATLHVVYGAFEVVKVAAGLFVFWLLAGRRSR